MKAILAAILLLALVSAENCGTYKVSCVSNSFNLKESRLYHLSVDDKTKYYTNSTYEIDFFTDDVCGISNFAAITLPMTMDYKSTESDVSNYSIKYTSASITFTTDSYSTKGITCTPTPEMDVTYNLLEMNCILDTNDVFLPYKALIGKSYDVSVKSSSSELIWNDTPFAYENKNGCIIDISPPNSIILYTIYVIVIIYVIIISIYFYFDFKKMHSKPSTKPEKKIIEPENDGSH